MRIAVCFCLAGLAGAAAGEDWPQWMGPQRDNVWREKGILEKFPAGGPKIVWRAKVSGGYAGPAVAGGRVFLGDFTSKSDVKVDNFGRQAFHGTERFVCLDERDGSEKWKHEYPVVYDISYPAGPRCTPTVDGDRVYALGAMGSLFCFNAADGKILWSKDFVKDFDAKAALWGYASHPLVDGNKLICVVGSPEGHVMAFDKLTGAKLWRSDKTEETGYSPPAIFNAGGTRQLIVPRPDAVVSLDPETGKQFWTQPYKASNGSIIMTPVQAGDHLFVGGYSNQSLLLELDRAKPEARIVWKNKADHAISPVNVQPTVERRKDGGYVMYGFDQNGNLYGVDLPGGKRLWKTAEPVAKRPTYSASAFFVKNEDRYFFFTEQGDLVIGKFSPLEFTEIDRAPKLIKATNNAFGRDVVWCVPAFANKRMYVRNDEECIAVDLAK
jgi:outer membrane protein assembly factor BamB